MASFKIEWKSPSENDLKKIDKQYIQRILNEIELLSENPFPVQSKKLKGSESNYRLRTGDYRVIYQVNDKKKVITIFYVRHRKDAYKIN